jgi:hypothetical protein
MENHIKTDDFGGIHILGNPQIYATWKNLIWRVGPMPLDHS